MTEFIWSWRKGNRTIYTQRYAIAQKAKQAGYFVSVVQEKVHIYR
jgi:hypothetical protein